MSTDHDLPAGNAAMMAPTVRASDVYEDLRWPVAPYVRVVVFDPMTRLRKRCQARRCKHLSIAATRLEERNRIGNDEWMATKRRDVCPAHLDALRAHCGDSLITEDLA